MNKLVPAAAALATALTVHAPAALSYVGPGAGIGMLASLFAMVLAVLATIAGIVLWPIRKLRQRARKRGSDDQAK
jgi:hypothetical protein